MKVSRNKSTRKNRLINLHILKSKVYKKDKLFDLNQTEIHFKKVAEIIHKYHVFDQRILFLGFPKSFEYILKKTKHILIPDSIWLNGIITNQILKFNYSLTKKQQNFPFKLVNILFKLKKKIDLIVVFNLNRKFNALEEGYVARIPIIGGFSLSCGDKKSSSKITYKVPGIFSHINDKIESSNFFFSLIKMVLKKSALNYSKKKILQHYNFIISKFKKKYKKKYRKKQNIIKKNYSGVKQNKKNIDSKFQIKHN